MVLICHWCHHAGLHTGSAGRAGACVAQLCPRWSQPSAGGRSAPTSHFSAQNNDFFFIPPLSIIFSSSNPKTYLLLIGTKRLLFHETGVRLDKTQNLPEPSSHLTFIRRSLFVLSGAELDTNCSLKQPVTLVQLFNAPDSDCRNAAAAERPDVYTCRTNERFMVRTIKSYWSSVSWPVVGRIWSKTLKGF